MPLSGCKEMTRCDCAVSGVFDRNSAITLKLMFKLARSTDGVFVLVTQYVYGMRNVPLASKGQTSGHGFD